MIMLCRILLFFFSRMRLVLIYSWQQLEKNLFLCYIKWMIIQILNMKGCREYTI